MANDFSWRAREHEDVEQTTRGGVRVAKRIPVLYGVVPRFTKTLPGTKLLYDIQKITPGR